MSRTNLFKFNLLAKGLPAQAGLHFSIFPSGKPGLGMVKLGLISKSVSKPALRQLGMPRTKKVKNYLKVFNSNRIFRAVCIGDSTTSQEWCHPNWIDWLSYTFRETDNWDQNWRRKIINSGRDGATIGHYLEHFNEEIGLYKPHVVIASIGLNNLIPEFKPREMNASLKELFQKIKKIDTDLITWSPYAILKEKFLGNLKKIRDIYKSLTAEFNGVFVDIYSEFLKYDLNKIFTFTSDGNEDWGIRPGETDFLHCNPVGCQIIAERISEEAFNIPLNKWKFGTMELVNLNEYKKK